MSVAVFSADPLLSRMLLLEARRHGLDTAEPEQARIWLIDLDAPIPLPKGEGAPLQIGFSKEPQLTRREAYPSLCAVLELPLDIEELEPYLTGRGSTASLSRDGESFWLAGKKLSFSKTEQALLTLLYRNRDRAVTVQELSSIIGESAVNSNAAAVYLYRLRRKLEADGITRIRTVRGVGYQWIGDGSYAKF